MRKVTAEYLGHGKYEVAAEGTDGKTVRKQFKEPFFKDPKKYAGNIEKLVNEFAAEDVEVDKRTVRDQLVAAAQKAEREFPNLMA